MLLLHGLSYIVNTAIAIYITIIIVEIIIHWLIAFEVIKARSPQAQNLIGLLNRATSPVMDRVRKYVPPIGGLDITPIVVIIGLQLIGYLINVFFIGMFI
jgi:YggT family protein|tara:strand:+ start:238106 stop:238405 length:300 start_codon:yes stop_codon:yes gene_type:complete